MSIFTELNNKDIMLLLAQYGLGSLKNAQPILAGTDNTNYQLQTSKGQFILTLFERLPGPLAESFLSLTEALFQQQLPVAKPQRTKELKLSCLFKDKALAICSWLPGQAIVSAQPRHCFQIGQFLAKMHLSLRHYPRNLSNPTDRASLFAQAPRLYSFLSKPQQILLDQALLQAESLAWEHLPQGIIHGDLFKDNALFLNHQLSGVIDFYFASTDALAYDLAVVANDWCRTEKGQLDPLLLRTLLDAYSTHRPLTMEEQSAWPTLLGVAATRFWLSRLQARHFPKAGLCVQQKNPDEFERILNNALQGA